MKIASIDIKISKLAKVLAFCWITFGIVDLFFHDFFIRNSGELTVHIMNYFGTRNCNYFSTFFSVEFMAVLGVLFVLEILIEPSKLKICYELFILLSACSFLTLTKSVYARGRPYLYNNDIRVPVCACDHGMPSGHSGNTYILIYLAEGWLIRFLRKGPTRNYIDYILRVVLVVCTFSVGFARILAGLHSYNQVIMGFLTSSLFCEVLNFDVFKQVFHYWIRPKTFIIQSVLLSILFGGVAHLIYFVNSIWRHNNEDWKYWSQCPKCRKSFDEDDLSQNSVPVIYLLFLLVINLHVHQFSDIRNKINPEKKLSVKNWILRLFLYAVVTLPIPAAIYLTSSKVFGDLKGKELGASLKFFTFVLAGAYLSTALLFLVPQCFRMLKIEIRPDFIEECIVNKSLENDGPFGEKEIDQGYEFNDEEIVLMTA